ncbi:hypothetical protein LOTGIDRAFT_152917 [Lottia gigantea]|uniref:RING-type domain-containing protein n=1 Tax=Lottia gigantea TaxID=225164 RepID=V4C7W5_LOTGI|nr:hypothetical protein LOTGIDRAFT_152917 [Lottia gigantea]ESO97814.1 hypothetical protein LOTGIDRAFT_152917 [Lottia gigantea]
MEVLTPNSKYETMVSYEENFYNEEELEMEFMTIQENAIMIFQFEANINAKVEDSQETKDEGDVNIPETEIKEESCEDSELFESETEKSFTVLAPKKQREAAQKKLKKSKKSKKKTTHKVKKWTSVDNSYIGINLTLFPRPTKSTEFEGDIDNILSDINKELNNFEKLSAKFQPMLELESDNRKMKYIRKDRHRKIQKAYKQIKTKYGRSLRNNKGHKKLFINHRVKARIQLDVERIYLHLPSNSKHPATESNSNTDTKAQSQKHNRHWQDQNRPAPVQNLAYALDTGNNPTNFEENTLSLLINLQHRELTPEDYELLSILDQSVAPKTVSQTIIDGFKTAEVTESLAGLTCSVCLELYTIGQTVKYLPCGHDFHSQCIEMWLSNSSMNCPLDGLPVDN